MVSQNVVTGIATCFVYIGLELITVRMDLIKSGLGLHKHKHSKILIPTNIFMAQIEENYISDFQIDVEKMEEDKHMETAEPKKKEKEKTQIENVLATNALNNSKQENLHTQLLSEFLETEKKYVQDLEEVIKRINQPKYAS